jgi:glycosyltransferase involved in cell wall biosynthesis
MKMKKPIAITFVATNLERNGAEVMLLRLLSHLDRRKFIPQVISLIDAGPIGQELQALGVPVRVLHMRRGQPNVAALMQLARWFQQDRPDVVQTWMYHADLMGGLAARLAGGIPVTWGIHQSDLSWAGNKALTLLTVKACATLSRWLPERIVCCSEASRQVHARAGYVSDKLVTIPNGYDVDTFKPDVQTRRMIREELEIPEPRTVIGMVARFHPQKDHANLLRAARMLLEKRRDICFVLCGQDITWDNTSLATGIARGDSAHFRLIGQRDDIHRVTTAFDIATLSSFGEAFPNAVSEAMSCGIPCVVTDVGDARLIVGETGRIVPPRDPAALASGWAELIDMGPEYRHGLGMAARRRVAEQFSLPAIVQRYEGLYEQLAA